MPLQVTFRAEFLRAQKWLGAYEDQIPFAQQSAINDVAFATRKRFVRVAPQKLDRPKPWIVRAWTVLRAKDRRRLQAAVLVRDPARQEYWRTVIAGGEGVIRALTQALRREGKLPRGLRLVPAPQVRRDRYGNVTRRTWQSVAARLADGSVFVGDPRGGGRPWGVWQRVGGRARATKRITPLFLGVNARDAKPGRFDLQEIARPTLREYPRFFAKQHAEKLKIARERALR